MENEQKNIFPEGLVKWRDIAWGVGIVIAQSLLHIRHEGLSDYPKHVKEISDAQTTRMATVEQNYDESGREG